MKLKFVCLFLFLFSSAFAEDLAGPHSSNELIKQPNDPVKQQFGYFSAGLGPMPIPLPVFAGGYRTQVDKHGFDVSLQISTIVKVTEVKTNFLYHH